MKSEIRVHNHGYVRYIDHMGTDTRVVEAARVSYMSGSKGPEQDKKLLRYLLLNHHTSPFEMCKIMFNIKLPIFVMRQYVRHRMQNLNEMSARYTELPDEFFQPAVWRAQDAKNKQGSTETPELDQIKAANTASLAYRFCYARYEELLRMGVARELARIILPVGIYTEIYCCWDLNNLLKFFALRDEAHAQAEIQDYARAMKEHTTHVFPWVMEIYEERRCRQALLQRALTEINEYAAIDDLGAPIPINADVGPAAETIPAWNAARGRLHTTLEEARTLGMI